MFKMKLEMQFRGIVCGQELVNPRLRIITLCSIMQDAPPHVVDQTILLSGWKYPLSHAHTALQ